MKPGDKVELNMGLLNPDRGTVININHSDRPVHVLWEDGEETFERESDLKGVDAWR